MPVSGTGTLERRDGLAEVAQMFGGADEITNLQGSAAVHGAQRCTNDEIDGLGGMRCA